MEAEASSKLAQTTQRDSVSDKQTNGRTKRKKRREGNKRGERKDGHLTKCTMGVGKP